MSDTFDHALQAFESQDRFGDDEYPLARKGKAGACDPLYYHKKVKVKEWLAESRKCYYVSLKKYGKLWIPKSICRNVGKKKMWVHKITLKAIVESKLKGAV